MKLDLGSFAFGADTLTPGGSPSWGTSLGQSKPELKLTYPGHECIIEGMMYKSIPTSKVFMPLGKGGHVYNGLDDEGIQLAAMFDKVFVNETRINANYILVVYKDSSDSWDGRRTLKYSDKIEYRVSKEQIYSNANLVAAVEDALQMKEGASWIVSDLYVANQDELHLLVGVVNPNGPEIFADNDTRKKRWQEVIQANYDDNPDYLERLETGSYKYIQPSTLDSSTPLQQIFYGAPGTGKSHEIEQLTNGSVVFRTTFHPDSDYSTFVGAYKPIMREVPMTTVIGTKVVPVEDKEGNPLYESKIQYEFVPQAFAQAYVEAWKDLDSPVFLVIEEINRGNCAQIFGDIFQLLDRRKSGFSNYYIVPDEDLHQYIAKAFKDGIDDRAFDIIKTGQNLCLPPNLYIWATMNTSDQSLFPIDSAFKRRWDWQYIPIEDAELNWKINVNGNKYDWWKFLQAINKEVFDLTLSEDKQLGYFFVQAKDNVIDAKVLVNKVFFYLWNDVFKDFDLDNSKVFRYADGPKSICFKDFYVSAGEIKEEIAEQILINLGLEKEA